MKQTRLLRTLLAAVCLFVGTSSVWGETVNVLSENYESYAVGDITATMQNNGWTFQSKNSKNEVKIIQGSSPNATKYFDFYYPDGGASRNQRWDFGVVSSLSEDNWTLTFSAALNPGTANSENKFYIVGTETTEVTSANNDVTNPFLALKALQAGSSTYKLTIGTTEYDDEYNLASGTWYKFTIQATNIEENSATLYVKVTSYDGSTTILEKTVENLNTTAIGTLRGICWNSPRGNSRLSLDDVLLTKESSAQMANYTVKYVSTIADVETDIKSSVQREGEVDATVTLTNADKNIITYGNHKYYYVSDNASSSTIKDDNSTVVKVVFAQATFDDGNYYLKNKATGAYFAAGKNWGTQAITNTQGGHRIGFEVLPTGKYKLNTYIYRDQSSSSDLHYLNANFCDGAAEEWQIVDAGEGYYTISDGSGNLTGGNVNEALSITDGTGDNTKWQILTAAQRKADIETLMESATSANGVDATFYITAPGFAWADLDDRAAWQGSPTFGGFDNQGSGRFWNAEKFTNPYAAFDVYQELTGLKPGAYKITMQGFYRNGFDNASDVNDNLAILYANNSEVALKNIRYYGYTDDSHSADGFTTDKSGYFVPNTQSDAAKAFNAGNFENELYVVVGNDGNLRIGVKKDAATGADKDWAVFDNFQLTYYGNTVSATTTSAGKGWATLYTPYALDFTNATPATLKAYTATLEGTTVTLTEVQNVPAGTGVVLKSSTTGENTEYSIPVIASSSTGKGHMTGSTSNTNLAANTAYILGINNTTGKAQFFINNAGTIAAGKAYLPVGTNHAKALSVVFANDLTGITNANAAEEAAQPAKRIVNGQLVIEKNGKRYNAAGAEF